MSVLGLDISTACTGWCILDKSSKILSIGFIDTSKEKCLYGKAGQVKKKLISLMIDYEIDEIFIEQNLQSFRSGFSSANTLSTLSRYNGIISYICYSDVGIKPDFINVNSARKSLGIKILRKSQGGKQTKEQILDWALSNVDYQWPKKVLKSGPRKGQEIYDPRAYDMIDAYIVSSAGLVI